MIKMLLFFVLLIQNKLVSSYSGVWLHRQVKTSSLDNNDMQPRKREAKIADSDHYRYSRKAKEYKNLYAFQPQPKQHQSYYPQVPNFQVRKLQESPVPYGYTVKGLTVTPPSSGKIPRSPTPAPISPSLKPPHYVSMKRLVQSRRISVLRRG